MRKILIIIFFSAVGASCNKRSCWECTITSNNDVFQGEVCDKTKKGILELQANPQETKDSGIVTRTTTYSNCIRK